MDASELLEQVKPLYEAPNPDYARIVGMISRNSDVFDIGGAKPVETIDAELEGIGPLGTPYDEVSVIVLAAHYQEILRSYDGLADRLTRVGEGLDHIRLRSAEYERRKETGRDAVDDIISEVLDLTDPEELERDRRGAAMMMRGRDPDEVRERVAWYADSPRQIDAQRQLVGIYLHAKLGEAGSPGLYQKVLDTNL